MYNLKMSESNFIFAYFYVIQHLHHFSMSFQNLIQYRIILYMFCSIILSMFMQTFHKTNYFKIRFFSIQMKINVFIHIKLQKYKFVQILNTIFWSCKRLTKCVCDFYFYLIYMHVFWIHIEI